MIIDLTSYSSVETSLFVRIGIENYRTSPAGATTSQVLRFSDYDKQVTIDNEVYLPLGKLVSIGTSRSEIRSSGDSMTINISGIGQNSLNEILYSDLKGSYVNVYRMFFNNETGQPLNIAGNPAGRFAGYINNYSITDELDVEELDGTFTINLECSSFINLLKSFVNGRRTNPVDQKYLYPNDTSFDRVPSLVGSNYNFGAPK